MSDVPIETMTATACLDASSCTCSGVTTDNIVTGRTRGVAPTNRKFTAAFRKPVVTYGIRDIVNGRHSIGYVMRRRRRRAFGPESRASSSGLTALLSHSQAVAVNSHAGT